MLLLGAMPAWAWGPQGHRVAADLANTLLTPEARNGVSALLGKQSLASASTWADEMRSNPSSFWQEQAGPWHYVTVPPGKVYADLVPPRRGDGMTALAGFCAILLDPGAARSKQQLALRFSLHIIQDLHQPLHVGNGKDRGGNRIKVTVNGKSSNLHRVWDSAVISHQHRSDAAWGLYLGRLRSGQGAWRDNQPLLWIAESARLREEIYPSQPQIDTAYLDRHAQAAAQRLLQAGIRSAEYLNQLFAAQPYCPAGE
ncbi:MAG: S1/P1 nuclease [Halieaceae bacterium]